MLARYSHHGLTWIDLESPTRDEIVRVSDEFGLEPTVAEELFLPSTRPRAEVFSTYVYLILHFPALRHSHRTKEQEVDFVIGKDFIITTHYDTVDPLHSFSKIFEVNTMLDKSTIGDNAFFLFFFMLKKLYKSIEHELEYIKRDLAMIEEHIFSDKQVEMVQAISKSSRDLLNIRQTIEPHREVLHSLETDALPFFGEETLPVLKVLSNEYYRVHNHVMRSTETLHELRETNNSLLTTRQNETMKIFTIMAFFTFPLSLLVIILDMDSTHNPLHDLPYDFWVVIGIITLAALTMFAYFRKKRWI